MVWKIGWKLGRIVISEFSFFFQLAALRATCMVVNKRLNLYICIIIARKTQVLYINTISKTNEFREVQKKKSECENSV